VRDRRGDPAGSFRGERLQLVDEQDEAWLVLHVADADGAGGAQWWAEGRYH
jgi:protein ImuB